jgi:RimJ/RimL family protein N-acetyltransferase
MEIVLETGRLLLRKFTAQDAALIFGLNNDPEVTRYTLDPIVDFQQAQEVLENSILPQYALYGHGRWAIHTREGNRFIGWCGLKARPELKEIDLGYRLKKDAWGHGYATEAAVACIRYGFDRLQLEHITGRALPANLPSIRVLEKCGMTYRGEEVIDGLLHRTYDIYAPFIPPIGR